MDFAIIFFQVLENSRGRFALISLELFKGRKVRIFNLECSRGSGWHCLAGEISGLPSGFNLGSKKLVKESQLLKDFI